MSLIAIRLAAVVATAVLAVCSRLDAATMTTRRAPRRTSTVTTTEVVETTVATTTSRQPPHHDSAATTVERHHRPRSNDVTRRRRHRPADRARDWPAILAEDWHADSRPVRGARPGSRSSEYCVPATDCARRSSKLSSADTIAKGQHVEGQQPFTVVASQTCANSYEGASSPRHVVSVDVESIRRALSWSTQPGHGLDSVHRRRQSS